MNRKDTILIIASFASVLLLLLGVSMPHAVPQQTKKLQLVARATLQKFGRNNRDDSHGRVKPSAPTSHLRSMSTPKP